MPFVHATNIYPPSHQEVAKIGDCSCNLYLNFGSFSSVVPRGISRQYRFLLWLAKMTHSSLVDSRVHVTGYENTLPYITYRHICNNKHGRIQAKERKMHVYLTIGFDIETIQRSSHGTKYGVSGPKNDRRHEYRILQFTFPYNTPRRLL